MKNIKKSDLLLWSIIIIAIVCIITLSMTREKVVILPPAPYVKGRESMKKPGSDEMPRVTHEPSKYQIQEVKKMGNDEGLKKEE